MAVQTDGGTHQPLGDMTAGDRVAVNAEVEGHLFTFRTIVSRVLPDALWLRLAGPDPVLGRLGAGQSLHLTFPRDGGALVAASTFLERVPTDPAHLFSVERPTGAHLVQRREQLRLDVNRPVTITSLNGAPLRRGRAEATAVNVGAGGVLVDASLPLCVGDVLSLSVELEPGDEVRANGQVIRIDEPGLALAAAGVTAHSGYRCAIRFIELALSEQERITRHLTAVQRRDRDAARLAG